MERIVENVIYTTIPEEMTKSHQHITSDEFCECLFAKYDCAFFKCFKFLPRHQIRFPFVNSTRAEVFLKESLSFRGVRLPVKVAERKVRVEVCNVPYEIHNKDIATALCTYGEMLTIASECYGKWENLPTGIRFITMKIKKPNWHPVMFNIRHRRHLPKGKKKGSSEEPTGLYMDIDKCAEKTCGRI